MGLFSYFFKKCLLGDDFDDDFGDLDDDFSGGFDADEFPGVMEEIPEVGMYGSNLSFTGLLDKGLVESEAFSSWEDGISVSELSPARIQEVANNIAEEFSQAFPEIKHDFLRGGFATSLKDNGTIFYDVADILVNDANGFGGNNVVGSVAHEVGHNIVERVFSNTEDPLSVLEHEIGADYIEGMVFGMTGIDPSEKYAFLRSLGGSSPNYLPVEGRIEVINKGLKWGDQLRHLSRNAPDLMLDYTSNEVLMRQLKSVMDDYV